MEAIGQSARGDPIAFRNFAMRYTASLTLIESKLDTVFSGQLRWLIGHRKNEVGGEVVSCMSDGPMMWGIRKKNYPIGFSVSDLRVCPTWG